MDNEPEKHPVTKSALENIEPDIPGLRVDNSDTVSGSGAGGAAAGLSDHESSAAGEPVRVGGGAVGALRNEEKGGMNYTGGGKTATVGMAVSGAKKFWSKKGKFASTAIVAMIGIFAVGAVMVGDPLFSLGALKAGLMGTGWSNGNYAMDEQGAAIEEEGLKKGEVSVGFANALAAEGIQVGQVTVAGDFIPTNKYIANVEELDKIAAVGSGFEVHGEEGELALLFEGEVITAGDFMKVRDENPRLLLATDKAIEAKTVIYYDCDRKSDFVSNTVCAIFDAVGGRSTFANWESTGDSEQDYKKFEEMVARMVNGDTTVTVAGCSVGEDEDSGGICIEGSTSGDDANEIISEVVKAGGGENASSGQLLNSAMTAERMWNMGRDFNVIGTTVDRSMVEGGPANELFKMTQKSAVLKYENRETKQEVTSKKSMMETWNFAAMIGGGGFDYDEAANFRNDNLYEIIGGSDSYLIGDTSISSDLGKNSDIATTMGIGWADLSSAEGVVSMGMTGYNSDKLTTELGGNYVPMGGGFLYNMVSASAFGGVGANNEKMAMYNRQVKEWEEKRIAAERATRSPFDVSSPYTFMGSIMRGLAVSMVKSRAMSGNGVLSNAAETVANLTSDAANGITGGVVADGKGDSFTDTFGEGCETDDSIDEVGTLGCTRMAAVETDMIGKKTKKDWDEYKKNNESLIEKYAYSNADRRSATGNKDAGVCEKINPKGVIDSILDFFGVYDACSGVDPGLATGGKWVMKSDGDEASMMSAFMLYDGVRAALEEVDSTTSVILNDYYAKHPEDTSRAGKIARISGMTKDETEVALAYADYLNFIARYDASDRYAFGAVNLKPAQTVLVEHSNKISGDLYCFWRGRNEYGDVRNRNLVA